jgi:hypothetical protein
MDHMMWFMYYRKRILSHKLVQIDVFGYERSTVGEVCHLTVLVGACAGWLVAIVRA